MNRLTLLGIALILSACGASPNEVWVSLQIASYEQRLTPPFPLFDVRSRAPSTALDHACLFLSVDAPNIANAPAATLPQGMSSQCLSLGRTSLLRSSSAATGSEGIQVVVPVGLNRRVRLVGVDTRSGTCGFADYRVLLHNDAPRFHVLGEATLDLDRDVQIPLPNTYSVGTAENLLNPCATPTLTNVSLGSGTINGGQEITLTGSGFVADTAVEIDSLSCIDPIALSPTTLRCATPAHALGTVSVEATNPANSLSVLPSSFTYANDEIQDADFTGVPGEVLPVSSPYNYIGAASNDEALVALGTESGTTLKGAFLSNEASHTYAPFGTAVIPSGPSLDTPLMIGTEGAIWLLIRRGSLLVSKRLPTNGISAASTFSDVGGGSVASATAPGYDLIQYQGGIWAAFIAGGELRVKRLNNTNTNWIPAPATGLNKDLSYTPSSPTFAVFEDSLFLTWVEPNAANPNQVRVAQFTGTLAAPAWTFIDGNGVDGLNVTSVSATETRLVGHNGKLYLFWTEQSAGLGANIRVRVRKNGGWPFVSVADTAISKLNDEDSNYLRPFVANGKLYVSWLEQAVPHTLLHLSVFNGLDDLGQAAFFPIDTNGLNDDDDDTPDVTQEGDSPVPVIHNNRLYLFHLEERDNTGFDYPSCLARRTSL